MFSQEGWKHFQEELKQQCDLETENADTLYPTNDLWQFHRGRKEMMKQIISYEQYIRTLLEQIDNTYEDSPDADCL